MGTKRRTFLVRWALSHSSKTSERNTSWLAKKQVSQFKALNIAMWLTYRNVMWLVVRGANIQRTHIVSEHCVGRFYRMGTKLDRQLPL